ncbi:DUF58 domain-containing protein [Quadrisphaera sp. DSM 44207]|uniref:DUF58 domain-containing protein n=1 Tax=Quadrisphaera sp. DSM 44207 TaxID=1881057 RepID=UPI000889B545|nr:DUF58 domain-containing protein [Quadrisphaera sp. DSM 44207]SDQ09133.1 Uncharacterized conserved protein, DUF58 family, contains vWF domain [Quadrisphaera sp. DSM 44207]
MALTGRAVLLVLLGVPVVALAPGWRSAALWLLGVVAVVALDVALAASPRALEVERDLPASVRLGEPVEGVLVVTNTGSRRLRGVLRDAWPPSAGADGARSALDVPPGERRRLRTALRPTRRGDRRVEVVVVRSRGPLGVAARQASLPAPGALRVLPPFASRRHLPGRLARLRTLDGSASASVRGQGTEFDSLREYVPGDDVRSIDWRATARASSVVVRTWRPERDRRVLVVLDTSRTSAGRVGDAPRLDAAMDAALLLAALASAAGDRVDLLAADRRVRASVTGVRPPGLLAALVQAMAPLEASLVEADWSAVVAEVRRRMPHRGLLVLLTPLEAAAVEESLLPVLPTLLAAHTVLVSSVADPAVDAMVASRGDAPSVLTAAAAERARLERAALVARMERSGAEVVDAPPELLPPRLADAYLALKAAGRL